MNSKNNRVNHDFQIVHFLAGSCHTADGAYSLLCDLREDRKTALGVVEATNLRNKAKQLRAELALASADEPTRLEACAELAELAAFAEMHANNVAAAKAELAAIEACILALQPLRRFAHLSDPEAHEAAQYEEWRLELLHRAENQLLTSGSVSAETFGTMRMHPAFTTSLLPEIKRLAALLQQPGGPDQLMLQLAQRRPAFLEAPTFRLLLGAT